MNARSRFSQSAIPNEHSACGHTKKTVVSEEEKEVFLVHSSRLAVKYIGPCLKV